MSTPGPPRAAQYRAPSERTPRAAPSGERDHVALRLRHLLAITDRGPIRKSPRAATAHSRARSGLAPHLKTPGADDVCACGRRSIGNVRANRSASVSYCRRLRRDRRGRPRIHHVGIADEPARLAPLIVGDPVGRIGRRIDGSRDSGRRLGGRINAAVGTHGIPDGKRHTEESLT